MTKDELRKIYLAKRKALSEEERLSLSKQLCDLFFSTIDLSSTKVVHIYIPIESKQEPDTWLIIDRIQKDFPLIRISIPKIQNEAMESFYFEGLHQLEKNSWGILEPKLGLPTPINEIDLVIVPLLAFDKFGHRVGYGKGFYDRFLKDCRSGCKKIGLSFFSPVEDPIKTNDLDVTLTDLGTPEKWYFFQNE
jgi:5-formyltetrahydrofolate cyclo-ligase